MKITVWGINYDPEPTGIGPFNTDLCVWLVSRGHAVTMLSTFAYYPWWKKRPEDKGKLHEHSVIKGVSLHRCWHYVPEKPSTVKRLLHEFSFVTTSTWRALWTPKPDVYVVVSPSLFSGNRGVCGEPAEAAAVCLSRAGFAAGRGARLGNDQARTVRQAALRAGENGAMRGLRSFQGFQAG
ncbi:MAG: glycosyltransferase [Nibricoccus sp.]